MKPVNKLDAAITAPPSKSYTHRALFIAALADGSSAIKNPLKSQDIYETVKAIKAFGIETEENDNEFIVHGKGGILESPGTKINIGESGTTMRLLTSFAALSKGNLVLDGSPRMRERPIRDLTEALKGLGVEIDSETGNPPVVINAKGIEGGKTKLDGSKSSQYLTSLLIASPYAEKDVKIEIAGGLKSMPYVDVTIDVMKKFGVDVERKGSSGFFIRAGQKYLPQEYNIEGDYSNASYFFAAAAITKGKITVKNLNPDSAQGDKFFLYCLSQMGCIISKKADYIELAGKKLKGISVDMKDTPDIVPTLTVVAAFAEGKTILKNVEHLRIKESDRIEAVINGLEKMGITADYSGNDLMIEGGNPYGAEIDTCNDHRIAMSFAVAGLKVPGMKIKNPECVQKSFPDFWEKLKELY